MLDRWIERVGLRRVIDQSRERLGLDLRPHERWLRDLRFKTVFDVGANTGQFVGEARKIAPDAFIYSFEPLRACFEALRDGRRDDPRFRAFHMALGDEPGEVTMHRNDYSQSSSLLPMAELHKTAFPETRHSTPERVEVRRLDDVAAELTFARPLLLKIDVQGFEAKVIVGATATLRVADVIIVETGVEALYEGQALFDDVYRMLYERGFRYRGNHNQLLSPDDGRVLQADAFFTPAAR
jgi:FkbM family methyltransferase